MRTLLNTLLALSLCGTAACADQAGPDELEADLEQQDNEDGDGEDGDAAPCRTALDCDYDGGQRCHAQTAGMGVCEVPEDLDDPTMQMGPAGQPPPPFVDRWEAA